MKRAVRPAARRLLEQLDGGVAIDRELLPALARVGTEPLVIASLALARLLRPRWEQLSRSTLVGDLIESAEAWLRRPGEATRSAAAALARERARWPDELALVRPAARRRLHRWKHFGRKTPHAPRDQFPLDALLAEKFARLAAQAAGATKQGVAAKSALETLRAIEGDSNSSPAFVGVRRPLLEAVVRESLSAWARGISAIGRPRRLWTLADDEEAWLAHVRTFERYDPTLPQAVWLKLDEHDDREAWRASGRSMQAFTAWRRRRFDTLLARVPEQLPWGRRMDRWWELYKAERLEERRPGRRVRS